MLCLKIAEWMANVVDLDEMPDSMACHLGLHSLLRPVCPNTYGKYGISYLDFAYLNHHLSQSENLVPV